MSEQTLSYLWKNSEHVYHLMYGLKCNYPLCCVLWFCSIYEWLKKADRLNNEHYTLGDKYSQCPQCYITTKKEKVE